MTSQVSKYKKLLLLAAALTVALSTGCYLLITLKELPSFLSLREEPGNSSHMRGSQPSITLGSLVSLEAFQPIGWYLRHSNSMILAQSDDHSEDFKLDTSWIVEAALDSSLASTANRVSLRAL